MLSVVRAVLSLVALFCVSVVGHAGNLPAPVGHVNDFAGVLPKAAAAELDAAIVAFEKTAPVRLVVVTIDSLGGQSVESYAVALGTTWKVGDVCKDNGIVFLVAVRDHKLRIQTARAARAVLSDAAADHLRDTVILPRFRRGDMAGGIIEGTRAMMRAIVPPPPPPPESPAVLEERRQRVLALLAESRRQQAEARAAEQRRAAERAAHRAAVIQATLTAAAGIATAGVLLFVCDLFFWRPARNRKRVLTGKERFNARLLHVETLLKHPDVKPEVATRFATLKRDAGFLRDLGPGVTTDWTQARKRFDDVDRTLDRIETDARLQMDFAIEARRNGPKLLRDLPGVIAAAETKMAQGKTSPEATRRLEEAKRKLREAETLQTGMTTTDWVILYALLHDSNTSCTAAVDTQQRYEASLSMPDTSSSSSSVDFGGGGGGFDSSSGGGGSSGSW